MDDMTAALTTAPETKVRFLAAKLTEDKDKDKAQIQSKTQKLQAECPSLSQ